jgi:tRNA (guanine37-N1)-methyltransferase
MRIDILSLFPKYFTGPFDESIIAKAREKGLVDIHCADIRKYATGRHRKVDDRPYGGGPGMLLMPEPCTAAIRDHKMTKSHVIYLSPQGKKLTAKRARELASYEHLILFCGHYEGLDQRVIDTEVDEEISIGDYVLTNGCLPAIVVVDALLRFVPGVLGNEAAANEDSFEQGLFDCPHYTRPELFEGIPVPQVLMEGNHEKIAEWRQTEAMRRTAHEREDLYGCFLRDSSEEEEKTPKEKNLAFGWKIQAFYRIVSDLKKSLNFYAKTLGLPLLRKSSDRAVFLIGEQELKLQKGDVKEECGALLELSIADRHHFARVAKLLKMQPKDQEEGASFTFKDPDGHLSCISYRELLKRDTSSSKEKEN